LQSAGFIIGGIVERDKFSEGVSSRDCFAGLNGDEIAAIFRKPFNAVS
jgi:hypothetical protein